MSYTYIEYLLTEIENERQPEGKSISNDVKYVTKVVFSEDAFKEEEEE